MARDEFKCACGETFWRREGLEYHQANKLCGTSALMAEIAQIEGAPSRPVDPRPSRANPLASSICHDAEELISGARAATHGDVIENHAAIAAIWNAILKAKWRDWDFVEVPSVEWLTPLDVLNMMEALKIMRRYGGSFNLDDFIDGVGYAALAGQVAAERAK